MTCAIMQPTYLPWIGYFDLIDSADKFVLYDDVQFTKQSWQVRNKIKTANGVSLLTVPVKKHPLNAAINTIELADNKPWKKKHLKSIFYAYQKAAHFKEVYTFFEILLSKNYTTISQLNSIIIIEICQKIGIETELINSSTLQSKTGVKDERITAICKELGCHQYLSTQGAASYLEADIPGGILPQNNIDLYYHNYQHPEYNQLYAPFQSHLCILDLLFNIGFQNSLSVIRAGKQKGIDYLTYRSNYLFIHQ